MFICQTNGRLLEIIVLSVLCFSLPISGLAQDLQTISLISNSQQQNIAFFNLLEDSRGFVWAGSNYGVYRLDGSRAVNYTQQNGLPSKDVIGVVEDANQRIWFCTFQKGVAYYDEQRDTIVEPVWNKALCKLLGKEWVDNLFLDKKGGLWIQKFAKNPNAFVEVYQVWEDSIIPYVLKGDFDLEGFLDTHDFDEKKRLFFTKIKQLNDNQRAAFYAEPLFEGISKKGMVSYSALFPEKKKTSDTEGWVISKRVVLDTGDVLYLKYYGFFKDTDKQVFLPNYHINDICALSNGSYIFSTAQNGLLISPSLEIKTYNNLLPYQQIRAIEKRGDSLCLKTSDRIYKISAQVDGVDRQKTISLPKGYQGIEAPKAFVYWNDFLLNKNIHIKGNIVGLFDPEIVELVQGRGKSIVPVNDSLLLMTTGYGFVLLDEALNLTLNSQDLGYNRWTQIGEVVDTNTIWLGSLDTLFEYNYQTQQINRISLPLPTDIETTRIKGNKEKIIFLGSASNGLFVVSERGNEIQQLDIEKQLYSNAILCISLENDTTAWVGTTKGVNKVTCFLSIDSIAVEPYVSNLSITDIAIFEDEIFVLGDGSLLSFPINMKPLETTTPAFYIKELRTKQNRIKVVDNRVELTRKQNSFQVNFIDINFNPMARTTFCYALISSETRDTAWQYTQNHSIEYSNLLPNQYAFLLTTAHELDLKENPEIKVLDIVIEPNFRDTIYFHIAIYALVILTISVVAFFIIVIVRRRVNLRRAFVESQLKLLRTQMNPHFIFNTLNAITGHIINQNPWKSVNYLSVFATLVRQVLENSKHSFLPLAQEIEMLRSYIELELLRLGDTYHIEVEVDSKIDQNSYDIPPMLIQPFVENAIIHGVAPNEKGTIKITIHSKNENLLEIVVEDNGVGRSFAATKPALLGVEKSAFGIKSIENHIHLINKNYKTKITLKIEDLYEKGEPTGTKVLISLPRINKASF
jgi:hypothetical protein